MATKKVLKKGKAIVKEKIENKRKLTIAKLLKEKNLGIKLDIGCGANKAGADFAGMDVRALPGVDIVHNLEQFPWPLPDKTVSLAVASHVLEHINPGNADPKLVALIKLLQAKGVLTEAEIREYIGNYEIFGTFMTFMDEVWRVLQDGGRFAFVVPYAGSPGYWQDPTHINPISEATLAYFDPVDRSGLWHIYKPKPWKIVSCYWNLGGHLEAILEKRVIDKTYEQEN